VRVEVSATPVDNDWVRMAVRDNGPGIPAQWHEKIFEPFRQGRGHQASGGSGLGLAICKRLARDEHGELGLCTPPEGGAEFWVLLPRAATTAGDP
ncbi:MAG: sensor histidine kinase, partial [Oceanococcaceae bacterium]